MGAKAPQMRLWRRKRQPPPPAVVLPSLDRLAGLIERVVELVDEVSGGRATAPQLEPVLPEPAAQASLPPVAEPAVFGWLAFVPSPQGYALLERAGPVPAPGQALDLDGARYRVLREAPSPLPRDRRRCVYLEREEEPGSDRTPDG